MLWNLTDRLQFGQIIALLAAIVNFKKISGPKKGIPWHFGQSK
jgi:hypothetical protein